MKKIYSLITAAAIAVSMLPATIAFADGELYTDYVPAEEIPANIIPVDDTNSPTRTYAQKIIRNTTDLNYEWSQTWSSESGFYDGATVYAENVISANPSAGIYGLVFKDVVNFEPDTSYVFRVKLKSTGTEDVRVTATLSNERADTVAFAKEYGEEGKLIGNELEEFAATLVPAEEFSNESGKTQSLILGFASGTKAGAAFYIDMKEKDSVYLAPEIEHDIKTEVVSDSLDVCQGGKFNVKAAVLNQAGSAGNLKQHFTWKVLNEDKTAEAVGFSIEGDGTDTAVISAADDTPTGTYNVVAISDDYEGFIKTAKINLSKKRINDIPFNSETGDIPNLILVPNASAFAVRTDKNQIHAEAKDNYYTVSAVSDIESANNMSMEGLRIQTVLNKGFASDFQFTPGKSYAVSAKVRKSEASTVNEVYFNIALGQGTEESFAYTAQYGDKGMLLSDKWQDCKAIITVPEDYDASSNKKLFYLGMPNGTAQGAAFDIEYSVYIGESSISKFECRIEGDTDILTQDNSLTFFSGLTNQIGVAAADSETERYIINSERNDYVTDFLTETDGNKCTVSADALSKAGEYYFVAETTADGKLVRASVPFTVEKPSVSESIAHIINSASAEEIEPNIKKYINALGINFIDADKYDAAQTAKLIKARVNVAPIEENNEEELKALLKKATVISLYTANPENVKLYNDNGTFKYADEIALESIDSDGVTIYDIFKTAASNDARKDIQNGLSGKSYDSIDEFEKAFAISVILNTLYKPEVGGSGYVEKLLTDKNAKYTELESSAYINAQDKSKYNLELARKLFTKSELEQKIKDIKNSMSAGTGGGSSGGSTSGGGGTANKTPSASKPSTAQSGAAQTVFPFKDVDSTHWAFADIYALYQRGIVSGNEKNEFEPETELTREQFVKMICELMGLKASKTEMKFTDADNSAWYAKYISAATESGIINGISENEFGVGLPVSRQDICVMVYRACKGDASGAEPSFADSDEISDYALDAVVYMTDFGIIKGFEDNTFRAKDNCTRAQAAKILSSVINLKGLVK